MHVLPMPVLPGARRETSAAHGLAPRGDIDSWAQHWPIRRAGFGRMDRRPCGNFARRIKALAKISCRKRAISSTPLRHERNMRLSPPHGGLLQRPVGRRRCERGDPLAGTREIRISNHGPRTTDQPCGAIRVPSPPLHHEARSTPPIAWPLSAKLNSLTQSNLD